MRSHSKSRLAGALYWIVAWAVPAAASAVLLLVWTRNSYLDLSDGVYAYVSRALLGGHEPYREVVAALPPPLLWLGAAILAVKDSIISLRVALAGLALATGALVAHLTWRLTAQRWVAAAAGVAAMITPYALKERMAFVAENVQSVVLLLAVLTVTCARTAWVAGALMALGTAVKLTLLVPAVALVAVAGCRRRYVAGLLAGSVLVWGVSLGLYGVDLLRDVIVAQSKSGFHSVAETIKLMLKAGFIELGLVPLVLTGVVMRHRARDPRLYAGVACAAAAALAMVAAVVKEGTDTYILVVSEPLLVVLAAAGLAWWLERPGPHSRRLGTAAAVAAILFVGTLDLVYLRAPGDIGPFSNPINGRNASPAQVRRVLDRIRTCPPAAPYSGSPYYAFLAHRQMAGGQADLFLLNVAARSTLARQWAQVEKDLPRVCPEAEPYQFKHY